MDTISNNFSAKKKYHKIVKIIQHDYYFRGTGFPI